MATQQQAQQQPQPQRNRGLPWKYVRRIIYILVIITLLFFIAGGTTWVLIQVGIIHASWSDKLFTILAGLGGATAVILAIFGIFQFILSLIPSAPESSTTSPPASSTTIQNIINVPPAPSVPPSPLPPPDKTSYRGIVGLPPPTDPKTIQQRHKVVKEVYDRLTPPGITAIALTGIGGIGKSTLAALIYRYAEELRASGNGPFTAESLWLRVDLSVTIVDILGNLCNVLNVPTPDLTTLSPQNQAAALFNTLNSAGKGRLIVLDQFEHVLDNDGRALPDRVGVGEWLDALNSQPCSCRVLLTSRPDPHGTREFPPTYLQTYPVEGLEEAEGIELLRKQDVTGTETELRTAVVRCDGHAYALTLLASLIRTRKLSLSTLLKDPDYAELWSGKVAEKLLDSIYTQQLDEIQRKLLIAFSVYREPVPLDAAQAIIDENTNVSKAQVESALEVLLNQHLLRALGEGRYQLHVIVTDYAQGHVVEGDEQANKQALKAAHARAAQYYLQRAATSCQPREQRRQISDVHDLIEAIWQYCQADQWQEAYDLMEWEGIFKDLNLWGGNAILLELYQLLLPDKWHPKPSQAALIYNNLGEVYYALSKFREALAYYEQSLQIYKESGDRKGEGEALNNLGGIYYSLGNTEQALSYYQQALRIRREVGDRRGESTTLGNLGALYDSLGDKEEALSYFQQALEHRSSSREGD